MLYRETVYDDKIFLKALGYKVFYTLIGMIKLIFALKPAPLVKKSVKSHPAFRFLETRAMIRHCKTAKTKGRVGGG